MEKIRRKKVTLLPPKSPSHLLAKRQREKDALKEGMEYIQRKKLKLYWHDEASFSAKDFKKLSWSRPKENITVDFQRAPKNEAVSGLMGEGGLFFFL